MAGGVQRAITRAGALSSLVTLMRTAQPDGQYSAAAALYNCAQCSPDVRDYLGEVGIVDVLCAMLDAESWYAWHPAAAVHGIQCWPNHTAVVTSSLVKAVVAELLLTWPEVSNAEHPSFWSTLKTTG